VCGVYLPARPTCPNDVPERPVDSDSVGHSGRLPQIHRCFHCPLCDVHALPGVDDPSLAKGRHCVRCNRYSSRHWRTLFTRQCDPRSVNTSVTCTACSRHRIRAIDDVMDNMGAAWIILRYISIVIRHPSTKVEWLICH